MEIIVIITIAALGVWGAAGAVRAAARDGYGRPEIAERNRHIENRLA